MTMFRRLQWKLTAYYTCFTSLLGMIAVGALLGLIGSIVASPLTTSVLSSILLNPLVDDIRPLLNRADGGEQITTVLEKFVSKDSYLFPVGQNNPDFVLDSVAVFRVVDADGIVIAAMPTENIGEPLRELLTPQQRQKLAQVYAQPRHIWNPVLRDETGFETIFIPIQEEQVTLGMIVITFQNQFAAPGAFAGIASFLVVVLMLPVLCIATIVGMVFGLVVAKGLSVRLKKLATSADSWAEGDFSVAVKDKSQDEIGNLGRQLNGMASELETLLHSRSQLAMIEERNRIARDLHDSAKQQIFATTMQLSTAKALLEIDPERAKVHIAEAEQLAKSVQKELSGLIEELRPAQLEGQGLFAAVQSSAAIFTRRHSIPVDVRLRGKRELPLTIEQPMFRILQEAFNNIAKHSQATQVTITLSATNDTLSLVIHDDGVGFNQADAQGDGIGLHSMQERITQISGKLKIKSSPENGTTISAECPIRKDEG